MIKEIPKYYLITGENPKLKMEFFCRLESCLNKGFKLIQLRAKNLTSKELEFLANEALEITKKYKAKLILNNDVDMAIKVNADGIHLTSAQLMELNYRPLSQDKIVASSCHNIVQLKKAEKLSVDFVTLSPVLQTNTHPTAKPLGWSEFSHLSDQVNIPIYALGGLMKEDINIALQHGAQGIAAISSFWGCDKRFKKT